MREIKGLELCQGYYQEIIAPRFHEQFPELEERVAFGLVGQGSDCLGFDDEISRDHDFGPGCCLWLMEEDLRSYGPALQRFYAELPKEYLGFRRQEQPKAQGRLGVQSIPGFYRQFLGSGDLPKDNLAWLRIPEHFLSAASNGRVFRDDLKEFSRIRAGLLPCYPQDVRLKKLSTRLFTMGQAGQYNYPRCQKRGDVVAARLALDAFLQAALSAVHLLNESYMPYYKWAFRSGRQLPRLQSCLDGLEALCRDSNPGEEQVEPICEILRADLREQGLSSSEESFLVAQAEEVRASIQDIQIRQLGITVG